MVAAAPVDFLRVRGGSVHGDHQDCAHTTPLATGVVEGVQPIEGGEGLIGDMYKGGGSSFGYQEGVN